MTTLRLEGLIAAAYTPLDRAGSLLPSGIKPMVERLLADGVSGFYVCGSTGEGMSLSSAERRTVAEAFVDAVAQRVPVVVQVGHNSLTEARQLAAHAEEIGCDAVSATCPSYFRVTDVSTLIDCMAEVAAAAPALPFYYYHIPALTGSTLDVVEFLQRGPARIATLAGLKYSDTKLHEFQGCRELDGGRFDVVWGCDEMLLGALATGAAGAIGSTYNIAAPLYRNIINAFDRGDLDEARRLQSLSVSMVRTLMQFPFHPAMKALLELTGLKLGACRLPLGRLSVDDRERLRRELESIGFFDWSRSGSDS